MRANGAIDKIPSVIMISYVRVSQAIASDRLLDLIGALDQQQCQQQRRQGQQAVDEDRHDPVDPAAVVAGHHPEEAADGRAR